MKENEEFWAKQRNDNPLSPTRKTVMVWAAHRGRSKQETNKDGILEWLETQCGLISRCLRGVGCFFMMCVFGRSNTVKI